ncbi:MAG: hypothetical protein R3A13_10980 [Bdellovibrionota bacterium]
MKKQLFIILLLIAGLFLPKYLFANDFDSDGIDDVTSIEQSEDGSWTWTWVKSSDGMTDTLVDFGTDGSFPCPGNYDGAVGTEACHIDSQYFWTVKLSDATEAQLNFGLLNPSYMPGRDFDGDGDSDLAKMPAQCSKVKFGCYKKRVRVNGALNVRESQDEGNDSGVDRPFQGAAPTFTGLFGSRFACISTPDIDGDGDQDICEMNKRSKNPRNMVLKCKDAREQTRVANIKLGKVFNCPLRLVTAEDADSVVTWKATKDGTTNISIIPPAGDAVETVLAAVGKVITGDWIDDSSPAQQVGIVADGVITIYNPATEETTTASAPESGFILDTDDSLWGKRAEKVTQTKAPRRFNSKTACRLFYCKGPNKGKRK